MRLHFGNKNGRLKVIAEPTSEKECHAAINQFLNDHGFKNCYTKLWTNPITGRKVYDVKSRTLLGRDKE